MLTLLALHAAVGAGIVGVGERLGRRAVWPALIAPVATLAWLRARLRYQSGFEGSCWFSQSRSASAS